MGNPGVPWVANLRSSERHYLKTQVGSNGRKYPMSISALHMHVYTLMYMCIHMNIYSTYGHIPKRKIRTSSWGDGSTNKMLAS